MSKIIVHNVETGEVIERNATEAELEQQAIDKIDDAKLQKELLERESARIALFEKLGITEEEAKLLLG